MWRIADFAYAAPSQNKKYAHLSSRHRFVQLPIALETTGGVGPRTATLIEAMADASAEQLVTWSRESVIRELLGSVAMFVCLLLCIRLVGGINGNADETLCWSAVCAASEGSGMSLHAHGIATERCWSPYQNLVGKGQRRTSI